MFTKVAAVIGLFAAVLIVQLGVARGDYSVASPSKNLRVVIRVKGGAVTYQVVLSGRVLIEESRLNLALRSGGEFRDLVVEHSSKRLNYSTYVMPFGKARNVRDHFNEQLLVLRENNADARKVELTLRAYDDGIAFRYGLPKQKAFSNFEIVGESTAFKLAGHPKLSALPLSFGSSYEQYYKIGAIKEFSPTQTLGIPLLAEFGKEAVIAITEADLDNYAGLYLLPSAEGELQARLAPSLKDPTLLVHGQTPMQTPWRVIMVGSSMKPLIESNLINNLNPPQKISDTSWIKPGKVQFPWWNGYFMPSTVNTSENDPRSGLNTFTLKRYIDFCAANGIAYHSIDGHEMDQAWYGGRVVPYDNFDITDVRSEIDMPEVLRYAREKGIGSRVWFNVEGLMNRDIDAVFSKYESWGISGIMADFLNRDDQEAVVFYNDVVRIAAKHHLTVAFHGAPKPTGLSRTYPNLLTQEGVLGLEYDKWEGPGSTADHEVLIAFIRMLAGPLDTHEGSFRPVDPKDYAPSSITPRAMGTLARQMSMYIVYENHLPMLADYPEAYLAQPAELKFVSSVPVVWDETRLLEGVVGSYIVIARRSGDDWYVGAINDQQPLKATLKLDFLGAGEFSAEIYADPIGTPEKGPVVMSSRVVHAMDKLDLNLSGSGGQAIRIRKVSRQ